MRFRTETAAAALLVAGVALFGAPHANAGPITGTDSIGFIGTISPATADDLFGAISSDISINMTGLAWAGGATGNFVTISGDGINNTSLNNGSLGSFKLVTTADASTFQAAPSISCPPTTCVTQLLGESGTAASGSETASFYFAGNFTPGSSFPTSITANTADVTMSLTETCALTVNGNPTGG